LPPPQASLDLNSSLELSTRFVLEPTADTRLRVAREFASARGSSGPMRLELSSVSQAPLALATVAVRPQSGPGTGRNHHKPAPELPGGFSAGPGPAPAGGGGFSLGLLAMLTALIGVAASPLLERLLSAAANRRSALLVSLLERPG
jgi:hypothetical protein